MKLMLQSEMRGLVRTSPTANENSRDYAGRDEDQKAGQQRGHGQRPEELVAELIELGCVVTTALVGPGIKPVRSKDAQRKQKKRDELKGKVRQINLSAPDNAAAREFLILVAKAISKKRVLTALRSALEDPELVSIGQKVLKLKGDAGAEVRRALGL